MRYILFGSNEFYYAKGGANDFLGAGNNIDDLVASDVLKEKGEYSDICWWHVFDTKSGTIVAGTKNQAYGADKLEL